MKGYGLSLLAAMLMGCSDDRVFNTYMADMLAKRPVAIEPLPSFRHYTPVPFAPEAAGNPFSLFANRQGVDKSLPIAQSKSCYPAPPARSKGPLERYPLASLVMQGTLSKQAQRWALIRTPEGRVVPVMVEQFVGPNDGQIVAITESSVTLIERIDDGNGCWLGRETQLKLQEKQ